MTRMARSQVQDEMKCNGTISQGGALKHTSPNARVPGSIPGWNLIKIHKSKIPSKLAKHIFVRSRKMKNLFYFLIIWLHFSHLVILWSNSTSMNSSGSSSQRSISIASRRLSCSTAMISPVSSLVGGPLSAVVDTWVLPLSVDSLIVLSRCARRQEIMRVKVNLNPSSKLRLGWCNTPFDYNLEQSRTI